MPDIFATNKATSVPHQAGSNRRTFLGKVALLAASAGGIYAAGKYHQNQQPIQTPTIASSSISSAIQKPGTLSPEFKKIWQKNLADSITLALNPHNAGGFIYSQDENTAFIYRPQDGDVVSEGMGYWMKILTNSSLLYKGERATSYQKQFDKLLNGVLFTSKQNKHGLMPWRMEIVKETGADGKTTEAVKPVSLTDQHSASDADIYIAWALIEADALVNAGIWSAPNNDNRYYAKIAADFLSKIKAHDIVEKNGRQILTVSDGWGHADILREAITVNPSYIIPAAFEVFANFDSQDEAYWTKVRDDNMEVLERSVGFSRTLFNQIKTQIHAHSISITENGQTYHVLDWTHKDLIENLLNRAGFELTPYGIEKLEKPEKRAAHNEEKFDRGKREVSHITKGKLLIAKKTLDEALEIIDKAHVVPYCPDQLEVVITEDGKIIPRIEFGEAQLTYLERYDGVRLPKELAIAVLRSDDIAFQKKAQNLLADVNKGKKAETARVDRDQNLIPLSVYLTGALGTGDAAMQKDFEDGFNDYTLRSADGMLDRKASPVTNRKMPRYYMATIAMLSISEALAIETAQPAATESPKGKIEKATRDNTNPNDDVEPMPNNYAGIDIVDAPLTYFARLAVNDPIAEKLGLGKLEPHFPDTAQKMFWDAKRQMAYYPTDADVKYNYAAALRNIGLYRKSAEAFYGALQEANYNDNPYLIMATLANLENTLRTLGFGEAVIADIFVSMIDAEPEMEAGKRMALRTAAIRQYNQVGGQVKALKQAELFFNDYKEHKDWARANEGIIGGIKRLASQVSSSPVILPEQLLLAEVACETMKALGEYGKPKTIEKNGRRLSTVEYDPDLAMQIPDIIMKYDRSHTTGSVRVLMDKIYEYRQDFPRPLYPRLTLAKADAHNKIMMYSFTEIDALLKGRTFIQDRASPLFVEELEGSLNSGKTSQALILGAPTDKGFLEEELNGKRNPFALGQALKILIDYHIYSAKILEKQREDKVNKGVDSNFARQEYQDKVNYNFRFALLINEILVYALKNLGAADYAGISLHREKVLGIAKNTLGEDNVNSEVQRVVGLVFDAALEIAKANPSADPRNILRINALAGQADIYLSWAENLPPSRQDPLLKKGIEALNGTSNIYLSNREHAADLKIQALMKITLFLYKQARKIQDNLKLDNIPGVETGNLSDILKTIESRPIDNETKESYRKDINSLIQANLEQQERFASILFSKGEEKSNFDKVFAKYPAREANVWAGYADTLWWGAGLNDDTITESISRYKRALEKDANCLAALRGLSQLYTQPIIARSMKDPSETVRIFKKALNAIQQGGTDEILADSTLSIGMKVGAGEIPDKLSAVYTTRGISNEEKARIMREVLRD